GGTGGKGGQGGNGGNGGSITVLYTNANGFNVTGSVSGGRKGPGGGPGSPGVGGPGGSNGGSGSAGAGGVGDAGSLGSDGTDGTDGALVFKVSPPVLTLSAITPNNGPAAGGTAFTLTGSNFVADGTGKPLTTVQFGSANAVGLVFVSDTQLTGTTPPGSGATTVLAGNPDGSFAVLPTNFTYT
ncbi:IPT/TIG domain-containing protein, partial [Corallococcus llansteffanensis]